MIDRTLLDGRLMLSFVGKSIPLEVRQTLEEHEVAGVTLFRPNNYRTPTQLRDLNQSMQDASRSELPLLIAIDQEGGQLHALGAPATMWPGNMALGAVNDPELTFRVAAAIGTELRAVGINVNYAPVADLASNPDNPATGARSFGEKPDLVADHVAAFVNGLQSVGVAATMKHFPGKGDSQVDSHHGLPVIERTIDELAAKELPPFVAAIEAGVWLAMTGHVAIPSITGSKGIPGTLSQPMNTGLLRDVLGFEGVMITDALDMKALRQDGGQAEDIITAVDSGVDLLLMTADPVQEERVGRGLNRGAAEGLISPERFEEAQERVNRLRTWLSGFDPVPIERVGSDEHASLCLEAATRAITLVKDDEGLLPLDRGASVLVIELEPAILTPADTTDYELPRLADEIRQLSEGTADSIVLPHAPDPGAIAEAVGQVAGHDFVIVGTAAAHLVPGQKALVEAILATRIPTIAVAQRTPWDLNAYPAVGTYLCAFSPNLIPTKATAAAIFGTAPITGRLPVSVGSFAVGYGLERP